MKTFCIVLFVLFNVLNCQNIRLPNSKGISGICIKRAFPNFVWDSGGNRMILTHFDTLYTKIYQYKNQILIQSSQQYRNLDVRGLDDDEKKDLMEKTPFQTRYYNFTYFNHVDTGLFWYNDNIRNCRIINKDSMLESEWAFNPRREDIFHTNYRTLISSKPSDDGNIIEEYAFVNKLDSTMTGRIILVFSKKEFNKMGYSMAKEIEQEKQMKLIKIVCINDARYIPPSNTYIERVEVPWEIKNITITNEEELLSIFHVSDSTLNKKR